MCIAGFGGIPSNGPPSFYVGAAAFASEGWWARQGSNLHGLLHRILSPARLPIPPRAHKQRGEPIGKGDAGKASIGRARSVQWGMNQTSDGANFKGGPWPLVLAHCSLGFGPRKFC